MWERGDKVAAIAEALGCEVSAVNVARARFGLKPRRVVPGRPRQVPDEPARKIKRVALTVSRLVEYCNEKELVAQTKASSGRASSSKSYAITPLTPARKRRSRRTLRSRSRAASRRASSSRTMVPAFRPPASSRGSVHQPDASAAGQRAEEHSADVLRRRRQAEGRDVDRSVGHQASPRLQRQSDQAGTPRQRHSQPFPDQDRHLSNDLLAGQGRLRRDRRSTQSVRLGQSAPHLATHCQRQDGTSLRRNETELDEISRLRRHLGALVLVGAIRALCRGADRPRSAAETQEGYAARQDHGPRIRPLALLRPRQARPSILPCSRIAPSAAR